MKQRVISGAACVLVLIVILLFFNTMLLNAAVSVLSAVAVFELLSAVGLKKQSPFMICGVAFAFLLPFVSIVGLNDYLLAVFFIAVVLLTLKYHSSQKVENVAFMITATLMASLCFNCIVGLRDSFSKNGLFYIIMVFGGAWFSDTGAFFAGKFFGKHKMSPVISPKKTVEGAIGGVIVNVLLMCLSAFVYKEIRGAFGITVSVNYISLSILAVFVSLAAMCGDLIASVIKRQMGIKDYGNIIPGHGGIMDRFDSIMFTAPVIYFITQLIDIIG